MYVRHLVKVTNTVAARYTSEVRTLGILGFLCDEVGRGAPTAAMNISSMISAGVLLATLATATPAHATEWWDNGTSQFAAGPGCAQGPQMMSESWVGYYNNDAPAPKTGYVNYVHVVAKNVGCTADAVSIEAFLPFGASVAVTASMPVSCVVDKVGGGVTPFQAPDCQQQFAIGPNGGLVFIYNAQGRVPTTLASKWYLELYIPVVYNAPLAGMAGGLTHSMGARVDSTFNQPGFQMVPTKPVTIGYEAQFQSHLTTNITSTTAKTNFSLMSYFATGETNVEFGTTSAFGTSTPTIPIANTAPGFTVFQNLVGLSPNTIYYWRTRFVKTGGGTYYGPPQQFTTAPIALSVRLAGNGSGRVFSNWTPGIDCGEGNTMCNANIPYGATVTLTPNTSLPYAFTGWSGACTGTGVCKVYMTADTSVTATFDIYRPTTPLPDPTPRR